MPDRRYGGLRWRISYAMKIHFIAAVFHCIVTVAGWKFNWLNIYFLALFGGKVWSTFEEGNIGWMSFLCNFNPIQTTVLQKYVCDQLSISLVFEQFLGQLKDHL